MRSPRSNWAAAWAALVALLVIALLVSSITFTIGATNNMRNVLPSGGAISQPVTRGGAVVYTPTVTMTGTTWSSQQGRWKLNDGILFVWGGANLASGGGAVAALVVTLPYTITLDGIAASSQWIVGAVSNNASSRQEMYVTAGAATIQTAASFTAVGGSFYSWRAEIPIIG